MQCYKCPNCDGYGTREKPPGILGDQQTWVDSNTSPYVFGAKPFSHSKCLLIGGACYGQGIIWRFG